MIKFQVIIVNSMDCEIFRSETLTGYPESNLLAEVAEQLQNNSIDLRIGDSISIVEVK